MSVYTYICMSDGVCTHTYNSVHVHVHVCTKWCVCACRHVCVYMCAWYAVMVMFVYMHACV